MFRSYNITTLATAFLVSLCIVVFCYIADPYKLYPAVPRLSPDASIDLFYVLRLHTPYEVERIRPSRLIVGNSRSAVLPPQLLQQPGEVAYNASLPGATLSELRRMVEHAHAIQPLQQVLVGLDLQMFEGDGTEKVFLDERARYRKVDPGLLDSWRFVRQRFVDYWSSLYTVGALRDSWNLVFGNAATNLEYRADGTWDMEGRNANPPKLNYAQLVRQVYRSGADNKSRALTFDELTELLDFTDKHGIETILLISPVQGLLMNTMEYAGAWKRYLDWQHELVTRVDARNSTTTIYGIEDRPRYVLEPVETPERMFRDGVHMTREAGIAIFNCLAGPCPPEFQPTRLDRDSIDNYLAQVDAMREQYARKFPADIATARKWLNLE